MSNREITLADRQSIANVIASVREVQCPCCGGPVEVDNALVDLNSNLIAYGGFMLRLPSPQVAELIWMLNDRWPGMVPYCEIEQGLWGNTIGPKSPSNHIKTLVSRARSSLDRLGLIVEHVERRGYRLVLPHQPLVRSKRKLKPYRSYSRPDRWRMVS